VKVGLTQKLYPGIAAREKHFTGQPLPKNQQVTSASGEEETNPVWLKEKVL